MRAGAGTAQPTGAGRGPRHREGREAGRARAELGSRPMGWKSQTAPWGAAPLWGSTRTPPVELKTLEIRQAQKEAFSSTPRPTESRPPEKGGQPRTPLWGTVRPQAEMGASHHHPLSPGDRSYRMDGTVANILRRNPEGPVLLPQEPFLPRWVQSPDPTAPPGRLPLGTPHACLPRSQTTFSVPFAHPLCVRLIHSPHCCT